MIHHTDRILIPLDCTTSADLRKPTSIVSPQAGWKGSPIEVVVAKGSDNDGYTAKQLCSHP